MAALCSLSLFLFGLVLPVLSVVVAGEPAPSCCAKGRCCCSAAPAADERTCLRRGCGCMHPNEAVGGTPLTIEAVLSSPEPLEAASPVETRWTLSDEVPIARSARPAVPPPRRSLSA